MLSAPCDQPSGQQRMVISTQASAALSLAGHMRGSSASRLSSCCTSLSFQAPPASGGYQTPPLVFPGCMLSGSSGSGPRQTAVAAGRAHPTAAPEGGSAQRRHRHSDSGRGRPLQHPVGAYMEGHSLLCLGQTRTSGGLASAARQALRWSLPQAHPQRHASLTPLPPCTLPGTARHSQPCHTQLPSLSCGLAVVCSHMGRGQPAASPPAPHFTQTIGVVPGSLQPTWSVFGSLWLQQKKCCTIFTACLGFPQ